MHAKTSTSDYLPQSNYVKCALSAAGWHPRRGHDLRQGNDWEIFSSQAKIGITMRRPTSVSLFFAWRGSSTLRMSFDSPRSCWSSSRDESTRATSPSRRMYGFAITPVFSLGRVKCDSELSRDFWADVFFARILFSASFRRS